jgi:uncharacterized membrane protein
VIPAAILIAIEGLSVGLLAWTVLTKPGLASYVAANELPRAARTLQLIYMFGGAVALSVTAGILVWAGRGSRSLQQVSARLSPLLLAGPLPLLFRWKVWQGRELTFLALAAIYGLAGAALMRRSLEAQPLFQRIRLSQRLAAGWARLRHLAPWLPLAIVCLGAIGYSVFFSYHTIIFHWNVHSRSFDLGLENNLMWNLVHGEQFFKTSPLLGPKGSHFGYHAYFFAYLIAPIYALAQRPETLLVIQATLMGGAAIPLFFVARRRVGVGAACVLALCYLLYPPLHGANLYDFHYTPLSTFFLFTTFYLLDARRDRLAILAIIVTLSVREDIPPGLVVIGLYFILSGERPRAGAILAIVATLYFVVLKMILMPLALAQSSSYTYIYQALLPRGESGYGGVMKTLIGNPAYTLHTLLERDKLVYLLEIMAPLAWLSLRRQPTWVLFLPGFLFTLLSTGYAPVIQTSFQYTAHWTTYVFLAAVLHLSSMAKDRLHGRIRQQACLIAAVLTTLACSYQNGAFMQQQKVRGGFGLYKFTTDGDDLGRREDLKALLALVPPRAKIAGSECVVPHISSRPDAYTIRVGLFDAEYILFSIQEEAGGERAPVVQALQSKAFGVVQVRPRFALLRRGHPTEGNAALLKKLGY